MGCIGHKLSGSVWLQLLQVFAVVVITMVLLAALHFLPWTQQCVITSVLFPGNEDTCYASSLVKKTSSENSLFYDIL